MNIINHIADCLSELNVPVLWNLRPNTFPSITFTVFLSQPEYYGDGKVKGIRHYIQVDVWSKNDYTGLVNSVNTALRQYEFIKQSEGDSFEPEVNVYHKIMKFNYMEGEL